MALKLGATNLNFLGAFQDLRKYLQAVFGQCVAVPRKIGTATVAAAATSAVVTDAGIAAGDVIVASVKTQGATAGTFVTSVAITAGTSFAIGVNQEPGTGGADINYVVFRPVP